MNKIMQKGNRQIRPKDMPEAAILESKGYKEIKPPDSAANASPKSTKDGGKA